MDGSRRPVQAWEQPYLDTLAERIRAIRAAAGLTQTKLAAAAEISTSHLQRLEHGRRRTRMSTLNRLAASVTNDPRQQDHLLNDLVSCAGPALAPESDYQDRVTRRRQARHRPRTKQPQPARLAA